MSAPFTHTKLTDVKDSAPEFGMGDVRRRGSPRTTSTPRRPASATTG